MTDRNTVLGYAAGAAAGISYGMNPLFAKHLLAEGVPVSFMLMFRYGIAMVIMLGWILLRKEKLSVNPKQAGILFVLGILFSASSLTLFQSYRFVPSGLATTLVYLYPALVALTMVFRGVFPSWQNWVAIIATFMGVAILSMPNGSQNFRWEGIAFACASALVYAWYLVIVNVSGTIKGVSSHVLTFYALLVGTVWFSSMAAADNAFPTQVSFGAVEVGCLIGLAVFPTLISLLTLAISTRKIGATRTSILGVFEPLTAILIGTCVFGEPFTIKVAAGAGICISAIIFMIISPGKKQKV